MPDDISELPDGIRRSSAEDVRSQKLFIAEMPHFFDDVSDRKKTTATGLDVEHLRQVLTKSYQTLQAAMKELQGILKGGSKKVKFGKGTKFEVIKQDVNKAFAELNQVLINVDSDDLKASREKYNDIFKDLNSVLSLTGEVRTDDLLNKKKKKEFKDYTVDQLKAVFEDLNASLDAYYQQESNVQAGAGEEDLTSLDAAQGDKSRTSLENKLLMFRVRLKGRSESVRTSERYWTDPGEANREKEYTEQRVRWNWWSKRRERIDTEESAWKEIADFEKTLPPMQIDAFTVREYEAALFLKNGKLVGLVPSGLWEIDPEAQSTGTEIIWIDTTEFMEKWGIPLVEEGKGSSGKGILTADYQRVGAFGECRFKIIDPVKFVMNLVSEKKSMLQKDLVDYIKSTVLNSIKQELQEHKALELLRKQDEFEVAVRARLQEDIERWGLELTSLQVLGIKLPKEAEEQIKNIRGVALREENLDMVTSKEAELDIQQARLDAIKAQKMGQYQKVKAEADADTTMFASKIGHEKAMQGKKFQKEEAILDEMGDEELLGKQMALKKKKLEIGLMEEEAGLEKEKIGASKAFVDQDVASRGSELEMKQGLNRAKVTGAKGIAERQYDYDMSMKSAEFQFAELEKDKEVELAKAGLEKHKIDYEHEENLADIDANKDIEVTRGNADSELAKEVQDVSLRGMNYAAGGMSRTQIYKRLAEIEADIEEVQNSLTAIDEGEDKQHLSEQGVVQDKRNLNRRLADLQNEKKGLEKSLLG